MLGMWQIMQWWRKPAPPVHPALFRITDSDGRPVDSVSVRAEYLPSGRSFEEHRVTAQGLCIFAWPVLADRLRLTLRGPQGCAQVEVGVSRRDPERVIEVALLSEPSAEPFREQHAG